MRLVCDVWVWDMLFFWHHLFFQVRFIIRDYFWVGCSVSALTVSFYRWLYGV